MEGLVWIIPAAIVVSMVAVLFLVRDVLRRPIDRSAEVAELQPSVRALEPAARTLLFEQMQLNGDRIFEGATAFLRRQYRTIGIMALLGAVGLAVVLGFFGGNEEKGIEPLDIAWRTGVSFLVGAALSALSGVIGMLIAVKANVRTASAATKSLGDALTIAMRAGAVSGILIVSQLVQVGLCFFQRIGQALCVALGAAMQRYRKDRPLTAHVNGMFGLVRQVGASTLHLHDLGIRVVRTHPLLVGALLGSFLVQPGDICSGGFLHAALPSELLQERLVALACIPPHNRPQGRIGLQRRCVHTECFAVDQAFPRQDAEHPPKDRLVNFQREAGPNP